MLNKKTKALVAPSYFKTKASLVRAGVLGKNATAETPKFEVKKVEAGDAQLLHRAKQLHAKVYLKRTYIDAQDIDENGIMHANADPHQHHSDYFVVVDPKNPEVVLATARQIRIIQNHHDLPILLQAKLHRKAREKVIEVRPEHCIEISGLAKDSGVSPAAVLELYRAMWAYSMRTNHGVWLMACDVRLYKRLKILFGKSISRIGKRTSYKGGDIIPCMLRLDASHVRLHENLHSRHPVYKSVRRAVAKQFLYGGQK